MLNYKFNDLYILHTVLYPQKRVLKLKEHKNYI